MRLIVLMAFVVGLGPVAPLVAQQFVTDPSDPDSIRLTIALGPRTIQAVRVAGRAPDIDGDLADPAWSEAPPAGDFVEGGPRPGVFPSLATEFRVLFDDKAIYLGVRAYDSQPSRIAAPYPRRDDETRSDWIFVELDSRNDRRTGFGFGLNPRGVQVDATFDAFINYDYAWDAVWQGAAGIDSLGWSAEYRIPFSQLAYAAEPNQPMVFGLNVYRYSTHIGESADWSPRLPTYPDLESHFNTIVGLVAPPAPERLEMVPYSAAKGSFSGADNANPLIESSRGTAYAGADIRLRLPGGFRATAAIHPDFGQVEADPSQVNLTTFETYFPEQRPFFVEGSSQFAFDLGLPLSTRGNSFANEQPFYSRRIGGAPQGTVPASARFSDVPTSTTLLGAAKLSGRSSRGWSAGAMVALSDQSQADYLDTLGRIRRALVEPFTGFGVMRLARTSADGGSALGIIGTAMLRPGMTRTIAAERPAAAYTLGLDGRHRFGGGDYEVSGFAVGSRVAGSAAAVNRILRGPGHFFQRPDAPYLSRDSTGGEIDGIAAQARIAHIGGAWHWALIGHLITPGFEINDVGFQRNADWLLAMGSFSYQRYRPARFIWHWSAGVDQLGVGWDFAGERRAALVRGFVNCSLRNYWSGSLTIRHEFPALSTDVLRGGPGLLLPPSSSLSETVASDGRKPWQLVLSSSQSSEPGSGSHAVALAPNLTWRATDRLALTVGPEYNHSVSGWQYVGQPGSASGVHYLAGRLAQTSVSLTARADLAFSSHMTLQLYAQPFLSSGRYDRYLEVVAPRAARSADRLHRFAPNQVSYTGSDDQYRVDLDGDGASDLTFANPNFNQQAFNLNVVWRWEYRPGSTIYLVWTQRREAAGNDGSFGLGRDLGGLFRAPGENVVLVKVSYRLAV